jgi:hypothetical protein
MEAFQKIQSINDFVRVTTDLNNSDESFVSEMIFVSNSYIADEFVIAPDTGGNLCIFISFPDEKVGVEIVVTDVSHFAVNLGYDLHFSLDFLSNGLKKINLSSAGTSFLIGRDVYYRTQKEILLGRTLRFGKVDPLDLIS